jgi:hypothetical protein
MTKRRGKAAKSEAESPATQPRSRAARKVAAAEVARAPEFPVVAQRVPWQTPENIAASWRPAGDGGGELLLAYEGPLATSAETLLARSGTLRAGGQPWTETRDVALERQGPGCFVGVIAISEGEPVEAIELAFHSGDAWDNGGRTPLGFYEWSAKEQRIDAR